MYHFHRSSQMCLFICMLYVCSTSPCICIDNIWLQADVLCLEYSFWDVCVCDVSDISVSKFWYKYERAQPIMLNQLFSGMKTLYIRNYFCGSMKIQDCYWYCWSYTNGYSYIFVICHMAPNFRETIFLWISVIPCVSRKYWPWKFCYSMKMFSGYEYIFQGRVEEFPVVTKWKTFL